MDGWVRVTVSSATQNPIVWQVHIGEVLGVPGETIAASPGHHPVEIDANIQRLHGRVASRLKLTVPIEAGRVTEVRLPVAEPLLRAVLAELQPVTRDSRKQDGRKHEAATSGAQLEAPAEDFADSLARPLAAPLVDHIRP